MGSAIDRECPVSFCSVRGGRRNHRRVLFQVVAALPTRDEPLQNLFVTLAKLVRNRLRNFARLDGDTGFQSSRERPRANDRGSISALFEWPGIGRQRLPPMARAFCAALSVSTRCRSIPRACHPGAIDHVHLKRLGRISRT
jgi:hypothetical protein